MKKSIKIAALALAVVPTVCLMTACGKDKENNSGKVNIAGNYNQVLVEDYGTTIDSIGEFQTNLASIIDSFRLTVDAQINYNAITIKLNSDTIMKNLSKADTTKANEITGVSKETITVAQGDMVNKFQAAAYLQNDKVYIDASGILASPISTGKYWMNAGLTGEVEPAEGQIPDFNFGEVLKLIPEGEWGESLVIEKYEKGSTSKYKISLSDEYVVNLIQEYLPKDSLEKLPITFNDIDNITVYLVFENNYFQGIAVSTSLSIGIPQLEIDAEGNYQPKQDEENNVIMENMTIKLNAAIGKYNGSISMPKFGNDYQELDFNQIPPQENN